MRVAKRRQNYRGRPRKNPWDRMRLQRVYELLHAERPNSDSQIAGILSKISFEYGRGKEYITFHNLLSRMSPGHGDPLAQTSPDNIYLFAAYITGFSGEDDTLPQVARDDVAAATRLMWHSQDSVIRAFREAIIRLTTKVRVICIDRRYLAQGSSEYAAYVGYEFFYKSAIAPPLPEMVGYTGSWNRFSTDVLQYFDETDVAIDIADALELPTTAFDATLSLVKKGEGIQAFTDLAGSAHHPNADYCEKHILEDFYFYRDQQARERRWQDCRNEE